jgi:phosphate uptake regulator
LELRRVQETGGGTLLVSLPKEWGHRHGVSKGSFLSINEGRDGCLILDPYPKEENPVQVAVIRYPFMGVEYVEWGIVGAYLLGYDHIHVKAGHTIESRDRERVKELTHKLIGLEVVEETASGVKAQCLIDPSLVEPETLVKRMKVITISMLRDVADSIIGEDRELAGSVVKRDDEVDRIYFLLVRLLRMAVLSPEKADSFQMTQLKALDYRLVASIVESLADHIAGIAEETPNMDLFEEDNGDYLSGVFLGLEEMLETAMSGFLLNEIEALKDVRVMYSRLTGLLDGVADQGSSLWVNSISSYIKDMGRGIIDIADLIPPDQVIRICDESQVL